MGDMHDMHVVQLLRLTDSVVLVLLFTTVFESLSGNLEFSSFFLHQRFIQVLTTGSLKRFKICRSALEHEDGGK